MRVPRSALVLAAAAIAAGLAWWLLRSPGPTGPEPVPTAVSPGDTPTAPAPVTPTAVSPGETPPPADLPADRGAVTGTLVIPRAPGGPADRATLTVTREGQVVATVDAPTGPFRVEYPRVPGDAAPFLLRAATARRSPVQVALPARVVDAGELRLLTGLTYGGRLVDAAGRPVEGIVVDFDANGGTVASSEPSGADGAFLIPLPPGANLQGVHGEEQAGWAGVPTLEPKARGRLFVPVDTRPEGLSGAHEVVLEERPVAIRLRFLSEVTGAPVAGAAASLWSAQDFGFSLPSLTPLDASTTDAEGIYAPLWPVDAKRALVRVAAPGGAVFWTMLDRTDAEGNAPRDLTLPKEPLVLVVRCMDEASGRPLPGVRVVLGTNAGMPFAGTTDAGGEIRWAMFASDSFDPEPLEIHGWSAAWRDGTGNPRREMDMSFRGPPAADEGPSPIFAAPTVLRLGKGASPGLWVRVDVAPGAAPFRPQVVRACIVPGVPEKGWFLYAGQPAGPEVDAAGRTLWWFWQWAMDETSSAYMPKEGTFPLELVGAGRDPLVARVDRAAFLAAHRAEGAIPFADAPADAMSRSLLVVGPEGKPVAGALVVVIAGGDGALLSFDQRERERGATGADGRVALEALDPAGNCRVAAWDPATGDSGVLRGLEVAAPPEGWRLALEPPREFRVRVKFAGSVTMTILQGSLSPISGVFPASPKVTAKDGELLVPPCPVAISTLWIGGFGGSGYRMVSGPAASFIGKDIVLEKK